MASPSYNSCGPGLQHEVPAATLAAVGRIPCAGPSRGFAAQALDAGHSSGAHSALSSGLLPWTSSRSASTVRHHARGASCSTPVQQAAAVPRASVAIRAARGTAPPATNLSQPDSHVRLAHRPLPPPIRSQRPPAANDFDVTSHRRPLQPRPRRSPSTGRVTPTPQRLADGRVPRPRRQCRHPTSPSLLNSSSSILALAVRTPGGEDPQLQHREADQERAQHPGHWTAKPYFKVHVRRPDLEAQGCCRVGRAAGGQDEDRLEARKRR